MKRLSLSFLLALLPVVAQTSSVQGVVTDPQGGIIPGANVTATNVDTTASRSVLADDTGKYSLLQMPPGPYKLQVLKPGFATYSTEVQLQIDTPATLNIQLQLGRRARPSTSLRKLRSSIPRTRRSGIRSRSPR